MSSLCLILLILAFVTKIVFDILDIISVANTTAAVKNPFAAVNKLITPLANLNPDLFLKNITWKDVDNRTRTYEMKLTLLPHQILILPEKVFNCIHPLSLQSLLRYDDDILR